MERCIKSNLNTIFRHFVGLMPKTKSGTGAMYRVANRNHSGCSSLKVSHSFPTPTYQYRSSITPRQMHLPPARFAEIGAELAQNSAGQSVLSENLRFRSLFCVTPYVCSFLWDLLRTNMPQASRPIHLLWVLLFLKVYGCETTNCTLARA